MTTRERIVEEALTLFSIQGYQGTSVKNIADKVGIKDSSLYKHFSSKKEIFDTIVQEMSVRMEEMSRAFGLPDEKNLAEAAILYGTITIDQLLGLSRQIFLFYLKDEFASRFRRMLAIEQYRNREIYEVYRGIFMNAAITYQTALFGEMIQRGIFNGHDPEAMAVNFYAPIFFLLNKYDQEPQKEAEALQALERQIREFARIYQGTGK
ncbi:TetR/AcrR family transcriptional regulator [Diplocloster agilis]|uniref:TetR/AcrR family transcriptional regulator n=1 Tax=Diplocloster agilis TaxID=2850323 RepID=A0A949K7V9_9FIRM|nr:TetR/AcrR family transcriptional regulator [Diplocloster agilis]MBU9738238.1 TetR/AcrR family transcriptional regulator [Diplocloster agilis]MBU9744451.1 TetR/AcrR family transcriptional regulator [Diplocloster agilis]